MPAGLEDVVRPYQLPENTPGQLALSQYNLAANTPVQITPGFGGSVNTHFPQIWTGNGSINITVSYYMDQAAVELH